MDDFKRILDGARAPDPGEDYWNSFTGRVVEALPPAGPSSMARWFLIAASSAAAGVALAFLLSGFSPRDPGPQVQPRRRVVTESKRTVSLASDAKPGHILEVLGNSAEEKCLEARQASMEGRWESVGSLARSWRKIVSVGLASGIDRAVANDEDVQGYVASIRKTALEGGKRWREIAVAAGGASEDLQAAIEASEGLIAALDRRFGRS